MSMIACIDNLLALGFAWESLTIFLVSFWVLSLRCTGEMRIDNDL